METPEQIKTKLRKGFALVGASLLVVGLGAAVFWPRPDSGIKRASDRATLSKEESSSSKRPGTGAWPQAATPAQGITPAAAAPAQDPAAAGGLDEPAPPITLTLTTSEAKAAELRQVQRRALFEQKLKARLSPEEWAIHEQGRKIWEASNARSNPNAAPSH